MKCLLEKTIERSEKLLTAIPLLVTRREAGIWYKESSSQTFTSDGNSQIPTFENGSEHE